MAVLGNLRKNSFVLIAVIGMALFAFVIAGVFDGSGCLILKEPDVFDKAPNADIDAVVTAELVLYILSAVTFPEVPPVINIPPCPFTIIVPSDPEPGFAVPILPDLNVPASFKKRSSELKLGLWDKKYSK